MIAFGNSIKSFILYQKQLIILLFNKIKIIIQQLIPLFNLFQFINRLINC
jgi:hypothetical protein